MSLPIVSFSNYSQLPKACFEIKKYIPGSIWVALFLLTELVCNKGNKFQYWKFPFCVCCWILMQYIALPGSQYAVRCSLQKKIGWGLLRAVNGQWFCDATLKQSHPNMKIDCSGTMLQHQCKWCKWGSLSTYSLCVRGKMPHSRRKMGHLIRELDFLWGKYLNSKHRSPFQSLPLSSILIFFARHRYKFGEVCKEKKKHKESEKLLTPSPRWVVHFGCLHKRNIFRANLWHSNNFKVYLLPMEKPIDSRLFKTYS